MFKKQKKLITTSQLAVLHVCLWTNYLITPDIFRKKLFLYKLHNLPSLGVMPLPYMHSRKFPSMSLMEHP